MMVKKKLHVYPEMKESGFDFIGKIPAGWVLKQIKHLAQGSDTLFLDGDWIESKNIVSDDSQIRYITTGNIGEGQYKEQGAGYITEETFKALNCTEVFPGDLVISRLNPPIGRCCIIPDLGRRIVTSVDNVILRPDSMYLKEFLRHALSSHWYYNYTSLIARGATMQRISRGLLGDIKIPIPETLEEQQTIANFLDRKTALIDDLIAKKERMIELLKEKRQATITRAVTKGLDPYVEMDNSGVEWIGKKPKHWEILKLKYVASLKSGNGITAESINDEGEFPVYGGNGLRGYTANYTHDGCHVLIGRQGALCGNVNYADGKFWASEHAVVVSPFVKLETLWLGELLRIMNLNQYSVSAAQPGLSVDNIINLYIPYPPHNEQKNIASYFRTIAVNIDSVTNKIQQQIEKLREYRQSLIYNAVTGKTKVN